MSDELHRSLANGLRAYARQLDQGADPVMVLIDLLKLTAQLLKIARMGEPGQCPEKKSKSD